MQRLRVLSVTVLLGAVACAQSDPLTAALPPLPPTGGAQVTFAGRLTESNVDTERPTGTAVQGLPGDFFLRNDKVRVVIQAPGRAIGPCPFGGNPIDMALLDGEDEFGELSPFLQLGRTIKWERGEILRDGSAGGAAVVRFWGSDAANDFINLKGIGGFTAVIDNEYAAAVALGWRAAVTYILEPGAARLRAIYTFHNASDTDRTTTWGTLSDSGSTREVFHPGIGFGGAGFEALLDTSSRPVQWGAVIGDQASYGIVPVGDQAVRNGTGLAIAGVLVEVYGIDSPLLAFGPEGQTLTIKTGATATREIQLVVGRDLGAVSAEAAAAQGEERVAVSGTVTGPSGAPLPGARVALLDPSRPVGDDVAGVGSADADGRFTLFVPPGSYAALAEGAARLRSPKTMVSAPAANLTLTAPAPALLSYTVKDRAGAFIPAKIRVLGDAPATDAILRDPAPTKLPPHTAAALHSRAGDSSKNDAWDHPIPLAPGRYRVIVSRGPEWSLDERVIDLGAAGMQIDAVLDHVAPTPGYVASDFHQHAQWSPDSPTAPADRVLSYLGDGVDFISSSEHDFIYDYAPVIERLGARTLLASAVGVETTPFAYGHFIAFPLNIDPLSPNGGALDWGGGELGRGLPPPMIFSGLRSLGARVVQVNHPRSSPGDFSDFQQAFDRAGLRFDFAARGFYGDRDLMPVEAAQLGLPPDAQMFDATFDAVEIYNGFTLPKVPVDGERLDVKAELNLRDFMNFLSFGFTPTPTGVSDSHYLYGEGGGLPRTLVRVPDDSPTAIAAGLTDAVVATVSGRGVPKDIVVTNGPFLQLRVGGGATANIGATVTAPGDGKIPVHVDVTAPPWAPIDTIELFANSTFDIPLPKGMEQQKLVPLLCFTTRATPSARCQAAVGGARPLTVRTVETVAGVAASARLEASIDAVVDAADVAARTRTGAQGRDFWILARTFGDVGLFPVVPVLDEPVSTTDLVEQKPLQGKGVPAFAFTNAVFVDVDGGGWRAPFSP